jgi:glycine hydroxymethyltransferase
VANAQKLSAEIAKAGFRIVSGGTDNHLFLIDLYSRGITGKDAQPALDRAGITTNKNSIPFDPTPPMTGGGIRLGTPAVTTRGMRESDMTRIAAWIADVLLHIGDAERERRIRAEVAEFAVQFPLYTRRWDIEPSLAGSRDSAR